MKPFFFILIFLIDVSSIGNSQSNAFFDETIGFDCGDSGEQSKVVKKVTSLIKKEKFSKIVLL